MLRIILYYIKKLRYFIVLLILALFIISIILTNNKELINIFEKFNNKETFRPINVVEEKLDEKTLKDLEFNQSYMYNSLKPFIPDNLDEYEERDYLNKLKEDKDFMYKKQIDWSSGSLTYDELKELIELVGYHLNKLNDGINKIVEIPTKEQLKENKQQVIYYIESDGTMNINIFIKEIDKSEEIQVLYLYTFKLKYDLYGKITIS
jgi:hypothetical protein